MPDPNLSAFTPDFSDPNSPLTVLTSTSQNSYRLMTASLLSTLPTTLPHPHLPAFPSHTNYTLTPFPSNDPNYHPLPRHPSSTDFIEPLPAINYKLLHPLINVCNQFLTVEARERVNEVAKVRELYYKVHERLIGLRRRLEGAVAWRKILNRRQEVGGEGKGKGKEGEELETRMAIIRNEQEMKYLIEKLQDCMMRRVEITARFGRTKKAFLEKDMPNLVLLGRWIMRRQEFEDVGLFKEQGVGMPPTSTEHSMKNTEVVGDGDIGPHGIVFYDDNGRPMPYDRHDLKYTTGNKATKDHTASHIEPTMQHRSDTSISQNQSLDFTTGTDKTGGATPQDSFSSSLPLAPIRRPIMEYQYAEPTASNQLVNFPAVSNGVNAITSSSNHTSTTHTEDDNPFSTHQLALFDEHGNPITDHHYPVPATDAEDGADDGVIPHHSPTIKSPLVSTNPFRTINDTPITNTVPNPITLPGNHETHEDERFFDTVMSVNIPSTIQPTIPTIDNAIVPPTGHFSATTSAFPKNHTTHHSTLPLDPIFQENESLLDEVMSVDLDGMGFA